MVGNLTLDTLPWIIKKPKLDVENRDQHDRDHNNEPNYKKSEINEISSGKATLSGTVLDQ
ncbi:hypothetical protein QTP88_021972 [Uroleucon formosanum]